MPLYSEFKNIVLTPMDEAWQHGHEAGLQKTSRQEAGPQDMSRQEAGPQNMSRQEAGPRKAEKKHRNVKLSVGCIRKRILTCFKKIDWILQNRNSLLTISTGHWTSEDVSTGGWTSGHVSTGGLTSEHVSAIYIDIEGSYMIVMYVKGNDHKQYQ